MAIDLAVLAGPAGLWLAAGLLADGFSAAPTTRRLRRRAGSLLILVWGALVGTGAVIGTALLDGGPDPVDGAGPILLLPALAAMVVATRTVRRLHRLRVGAAAFSTAPDSPVPPALRAAAAHPLVVLPVQLCSLLALPAVGTAVGTAIGTDPPAGPGTTGLVLTAVALVALTIGVRHALRHSRLVERAVTLRTAAPRAGGLLQV